MRYEIETAVQGITRIVAETDRWERAVALGQLACVQHCSPSLIREKSHHGKGTVVYYGASVGETVEAANDLVAALPE